MDPLDREIFGASDENQAVPVSQLVKQVSELPPVAGKDLFVPLSDDKYHKLMDIFQKENMKVADEGLKFLEYVKSNKSFELDFGQNQVVKSL